METSENPSCINCGTSLQGSFCHQCGQKLIKERLTVKGVITTALSSIFKLDSGLWYTMLMMTKNPGQVIQDYINGKTKPYVNPFRYALTLIAVYVFLIINLGEFSTQIDQIIGLYKNMGIIDTAEAETEMRSRLSFVFKFSNFIPFVLIPFLSWATLILKRKEKWHFAEYFVLNTYTIGHINLLSIPLLFIVSVLLGQSHLLLPVIYLLSMGFFAYVFRDLFKRSWGGSIALGIGNYMFGFLLFLITLVVISLIIVVIMILFSKLFGS